MPVPEFEDVLDEEIQTSDAESSALICKLDDARSLAAYWQGVAEEREKAIRELQADRALTISYLKDRLNRAELPRSEGGNPQ